MEALLFTPERMIFGHLVAEKLQHLDRVETPLRRLQLTRQYFDGREQEESVYPEHDAIIR